MNEEDYDIQKIMDYLLANLSADETERFDELAFTDDQFAAMLKAAENEMVDAYLQGELSGARLEKFESYYLSSPRRREKVAFARSLQSFAEREIKVAKTETAKTAEKIPFWNFFKNPVFQFGFAAAALLIAAFGIFRLANYETEKPTIEKAQKTTPTPETAAISNQNQVQINENTTVQNSVPSAVNTEKPQSTPKPQKNVGEDNKPPPEKEKPALTPPKPIVAFLALAAPRRSSSSIPNFNLPKNAAKVAIELELVTDEYNLYHIKLAGETGKTNLQLKGSFKAQNKGARKVLNINFPAELLNDGIYLLIVSGVSKDGEEVIASYPFRSVIK